MEELAARLTMSGVTVDRMEPMGVDFQGKVVVGKVLKVAPHSQADRLTICDVEVGPNDVRSVVCGAPNVREGMVSAVALPGAQLPSGLLVQEAVIRGVKSFGMLCAADELGIGDDHQGIIELPDDFTPGTRIEEALFLDDVAFEIDIYANRPDLLSVIGVAREVAAMLGRKVTIPQCPFTESASPITEWTSIQVLSPDLCPRYCARLVTGVEIGPSPIWMQQYLRAAGMRPINNIVDITNFVMLETGQPLHAFDYDKLAERQLVIRRAHQGEQMVTLDGVERTLTNEDLVIADGAEPVCIAGIMGGAHVEVTSETRNILLESANFKAASVRRTGRRLGLHSEAAARFEKGLDPAGTTYALERACQLMQELAGANVLSGMIDVNNVDDVPMRISVRPQMVNKVLGTDISPEEMAEMLAGLELAVEYDGEKLIVLVPSFRRDLGIEADIIEEVARLYGYDRIKAELPTTETIFAGQTVLLSGRDTIRELLIASGLQEVLNYSFISPDDLARLEANTPVFERDLSKVLTIANPLSEGQSMMRTSLLPGLINTAVRNLSRQAENVHLFELGRVFWPVEGKNGLPIEREMGALLLTGLRPGISWGHDPQDVDFYDLKGIVELLADRLGAQQLTFMPSECPYLHPGRRGTILVGGESIGYLGQLHPNCAARFGLEESTYVAEFDVEALLTKCDAKRTYVGIIRYPFVKRDMAFLVPKEVQSNAVVDVIKEVGGKLVKDIWLFDVYTGKQVPTGYRSLAYTVTYQAEDRTLVDEEIVQIESELEERLQEELKVSLRR